MLKVYSKSKCPKCIELKTFLEVNNYPYKSIDIMQDEEAKDFLVSNGFKTVPQVFQEDMMGLIHVGDCDTTIKKLSAI